MPEDTHDQRELLLRPFFLLAMMVSITAVLGLIYLGGISLFTRSSQRTAVPEPASSQKIWVSKALTICDEAWHRKNIELPKYLSSLGVEIFDRISVEDPQFEKTASCLRCNCSSGEVLYLQVSKEALADLVGFVESSAPIKP